MKEFNKNLLENELDELIGNKIDSIFYKASEEYFNGRLDNGTLQYISDLGIFIVLSSKIKIIITDFYSEPSYELNGLKLIKTEDSVGDLIGRNNHIDDQAWKAMKGSLIINYEVFKMFYLEDGMNVSIELPYGFKLTFENGKNLYFFCITLDGYDDLSNTFDYSVGNAISIFFNDEMVIKNKLLTLNKKINFY